MRVRLVAEQLRRGVPGGIGTYVRGLVAGLGAMGPAAPEVVLWAGRHAGGGADPLARLGRVDPVWLPGRVLVWAWDRGWCPAPAGDDVVHATSLAVPPAGPASLSAMVHDLAWRQVPDAFPARGRRWHEAALGRALARASLLLAPSRSTADALVAAGAPAAKVEVVEEGSDHLPAPDAASARRVLAGLGIHGAYLLAVSTREPRKNLARLVAAYQSARPRLAEPWPLVVVGPAGWGDATPAASEGVVLAGAVDVATLSGLYAGARAMAYVPLIEGFGLPVVEAMRAGVPVVASRVPAAGGVALEVDPLDVDAIASGLVRVANDEDVRDELVAAGRQRTEPLTWEATARRHVEIWEALAR